MTLLGCDVADHQGPHPAYPPGTEFVIIKASGGHDYRNPLLGQQVADAQARGLLYGFYHYMFEPTFGGGDFRREATNFIETVRPYVQPGTTFWLDVEEYPKTVGYTGNLAAWIIGFCDQVEAAFDCDCGIYCATWYLTATGLDKVDALAGYPFWMASWQQAIPDPHYMAPWDHLTLHQYDADGIDKDRFYGTREEFLALGIPAPSPLPATADPITAETVIGPDGVPVTTIRWGGQATEVLGTDYVDIGVRVKNASGRIYHRSIQNGQGQQYVEE